MSIMSADDSTPSVSGASRPTAGASQAQREGLTVDDLTPAQTQRLLETALRRLQEADDPRASSEGTPPVSAQSLLNSCLVSAATSTGERGLRMRAMNGTGSRYPARFCPTARPRARPLCPLRHGSLWGSTPPRCNCPYPRSSSIREQGSRGE